MTAAILSVHEANVTFGKKPLFETLSFHIYPDDKTCLVGRNGAGKSTLMQIVTGARELDGGERWVEPGTTIGYLEQQVKVVPGQTVIEFIMSGLPEEKNDENHRYLAEMMMEPFELRPFDDMAHLSGGQLRRAALARSLVEEPDILLLDEPTNHLDIAAIEWLEGYLAGYKGALLCVSHDKKFLANISNKIFWLDRGQVRVCPQGFAHFDEWSEALLDQETRELEKRHKILAQEVEWASRGVKARRKRNMRRIEKMQQERDRLKQDQRSFNAATRKIQLRPIDDNPETASRVLAEFIKVDHQFGEGKTTKRTLEHFSLKLLRGDRYGLLGRNGSGKTTFLKLLTGELEPLGGKIKRARDIRIAYFDQNRRALKDNETIWQTLCPQGGEYVDVAGTPRHVCGYLKDFMFEPTALNDKVSTLSGGQKNRLMLAKVLSNPGDLLILDEPTNDLDMDTLDMLEEILIHYPGTLLVVSHDRDFLDQTVSRLLAFEGDGRIESVVGGYEDYVRTIRKSVLADAKAAQPVKKKPGKAETKQTESKQTVEPTAAPKRKPHAGLSYNEQLELKKLPARLETLGKELAALQATLADPNAYASDRENFTRASRQITHVQAELEQAETRWLELEALREGVA